MLNTYVIIQAVHRGNSCIITWKDFVEVSKNLALYKSENNFIELLK